MAQHSAAFSSPSAQLDLLRQAGYTAPHKENAMPRFRSLKHFIRLWLAHPSWSKEQPLPDIPEITEAAPLSLVNPLFACLTEGGETADRAAYALGGVMARVYRDSPENAKNIVRRFMWHMNEESGNIGWGIPEAFAQTLAQCPELAKTYRQILFYYIYDAPEEKSTVFCDHAPLRLSCYKAIDILLSARPDLAGEAMPLLRIASTHEKDRPCRDAASALVRKFMLTSYSGA